MADAVDERRSTFELTGRRRFALGAVSGAAWADAATSIAAIQGVPLDVLEIDGDWQDTDGAWAAQREVAPGGAVLGRPDEYVAWRSMTAHPVPAEVLGAPLPCDAAAG